MCGHCTIAKCDLQLAVVFLSVSAECMRSAHAPAKHVLARVHSSSRTRTSTHRLPRDIRCTALARHTQLILPFIDVASLLYRAKLADSTRSKSYRLPPRPPCRGPSLRSDAALVSLIQPHHPSSSRIRYYIYHHGVFAVTYLISPSTGHNLTPPASVMGF